MAMRRPSSDSALAANLSTSEIKAAQHLIGSFNLNETAEPA